MPRPRSGRGGARQGMLGVAHGQRTDLNQPKPLPVEAGPQDQYGQRKALEDQQRDAPIVASASTPPPPGGAGSGAVTPLTAPLPIDRPTERPHEPMQAGLSTGPGGGPGVLGLGPGAGDLSMLASFLPTLELLASRPGTTEDTRNYVRLLRANLTTGA